MCAVLVFFKTKPNNTGAYFMISALALFVCLAALARYIIKGTIAVRRLRSAQGPLNRRTFFRDKIRQQWITMIALPLAALLVSGRLALAFAPGASVAQAADAAANWTGIQVADLEFNWGLMPSFLCTVGLAIVVLEALPILLRSNRKLIVGNFTTLLPRTPREAGYTALLALGAGAGEELLFRAEIPFALAALGLPILWGFLLSAALFAACHAYQGWIGMIAVAAVGLLLTAIYVISGSLWLVIALHVAIDMVGLVIRPLTGMAIRAAITALSPRFRQ